MTERGRHFRGTYDTALRELEADVARLGRLCGDLIHRAVDALVRQDPEQARAVIAADDDADRLHLEVERQVARVIATQQPVATDLRELLSILVISLDLERMADHAEAVARAVLRLGRGPLPASVGDIVQMEQVIQRMLSDALQSFAGRDAVLAEAVSRQDDVVDALRSRVVGDLLTAMREDPGATPRAVDLILVAQHLERAADHITNVAERVVYIATGQLRELNV
ncbi:MAG: phosphate signaling complex protein PhoU [Armatimonadota bacterium]|nr:phosphate signaling complex protein PhoU [Armatimonadota bacterium]MDR7436212.1 phosphate signaling complex protein PhoU [Armatimonadota bacterium]MDR7471407.1 phosphate signaling complex protein PhoU [Armatimonadota bacterium]MDR7507182.1 phosphate signaling complex protein PhoU [Armatimonadota bacterium]MDR7509546.1 phosphate signaling complex protein PhoU [Armatimonadota bacterium]